MTRSEDVVTQVMAGGEDSGVSGGVSLGQRLSQGDGDQGGQGQQRPHGLQQRLVLVRGSHWFMYYVLL